MGVLCYNNFILIKGAYKLEYNIYCDESSHLVHSDNRIMTLGFISCDKNDAKKFNRKLKNIKIKNDLNKNYELKWTKVSKSKMDYYKQLVDYFFESDLSFRCIVADKSTLDYKRYKHTHDDWYYKMYYLLLGKTLDESSIYNIYLDIKDTNSNNKIIKLREILNNSYYKFTDQMIKNLQHVNSKEIELIQLVDLFIGAIAYKNNNLSTSEAKLELVNYISNKSNKNLNTTTLLGEEKFNIFIWKGNFRDAL